MKKHPLFSLFLMGTALSSPVFAQKSPHIILIMTDQQRADALGCMGNEAVVSPAIDELAAEGTLFVNAYSSCPSSTPARAGLLTGFAPWKHGMLGYGQVAEKGIIHLVSERCIGIRRELSMDFMELYSTKAVV